MQIQLTSLKEKVTQIILHAAAAAKSLQSFPTLRPHRRQPTRLPCPWDSPGKNTGAGCHFLLLILHGFDLIIWSLKREILLTYWSELPYCLWKRHVPKDCVVLRVWDQTLASNHQSQGDLCHTSTRQWIRLTTMGFLGEYLEFCQKYRPGNTMITTLWYLKQEIKLDCTQTLTYKNNEIINGGVLSDVLHHWICGNFSLKAVENQYIRKDRKAVVF